MGIIDKEFQRIMKKFITIFLVTAVIGTGAVIIFAQKGFKGGRGGHPFERIAAKLGLSDEQKTQAQTVLAGSKERIKPIAQQLRANREEVEKLGTDGVFNEAEVNRLATAQTDLMRQMFIERERTKAELFAILTPEQRVQAVELKEAFKNNFRERFKNRFGRGGGPGMKEGFGEFPGTPIE